MAKFYGPIGYANTSETAPGVWTESITEHNYYGDVIRNVNRMQIGDKLNDDVVLDNRISILADAFASENFQSMRYIKWMGVYWKITSVEVQHPRLLLTIGGIYNGSKA